MSEVVSVFQKNKTDWNQIKKNQRLPDLEESLGVLQMHPRWMEFFIIGNNITETFFRSPGLWFGFLYLAKGRFFFEQKRIMDGIERLCDQLPGTPAKLCKDEVEKFFPVAVTFLTTAVVSLWIMSVMRKRHRCILTHSFSATFPRNHLRCARSSGSARSRRSCFRTSWMSPFRQLRWPKTSVNRTWAKRTNC